MAIQLYKVHKILIFLSIVFVCFVRSINIPMLSFLGGLGRNGSTYPLLLGITIWLCSLLLAKKRQLYCNKSITALGMLFFIMIVSFIFNYDNVMESSFFEQNGFKRYVTQVASFFFCGISVLYLTWFFQSAKKKIDIYDFIAKAVFFSFLISAIYSGVEISSYLTASGRELLHALDSVFRGSSGYELRIRSLAFEASAFGVYCSFVFPWILYLAIKKRRLIYYLMTLFLVILAILSLSRTAYAIILLEALFMTFFQRRNIHFDIKKLSVFFVVVLLLVFVLAYINKVADLPYDFSEILLSLTISNSENNVHDLSNITRYGSWAAALTMFEENPIWGIGWGQFMIHAVDYYPGWSWISAELIDVASGRREPTTYNIYLRFLAELGITGFLVWVFIWIRILIITIIRVYKHNILVNQILLTCLVGLILAQFNIDMMFFLPYWLAIVCIDMEE